MRCDAFTNQGETEHINDQWTVKNYCNWKEPKHVGRTQKTSFPLSSDSKASLCSDFITNPNSCACKSRRSSTAIYGESFRKPPWWGKSQMTCWKHNLIAYWQLASKFSQWNCLWLHCNMNEYIVFLASLPKSRSPLSASLQTFSLTACAYLNTDHFAVYHWTTKKFFVGIPLDHWIGW